MKNITRKDFFKLSGFAALSGAILGTNSSDKTVFASSSPFTRLDRTKVYHTICPYCSVGCGIICHVKDGVVVNVEGDPKHPINEGKLCSKGTSIYNLSYVYDSKKRPKAHSKRLTEVKYRRPGAKDWETISWDEAFEKIAKRIKNTRDKSFEKRDAEGVTVNRTQAIAHLGSAVCTNEENYLYHKLVRSLGIINLDHCARL